METKANISSEPKKRGSGNAMNTKATWLKWNERHGIEDCKNYLQQILEKRNKFIFKKEHYYGRLKNITRERIAKTSVRKEPVKCATRNIQQPCMVIVERMQSLMVILEKPKQ